ncbi:MAG: hypothetical protein NT062_06395, partial [Proteobacteria bacterium]|nr:hypothetical protein [Pseudomonadota bacterium]
MTDDDTSDLASFERELMISLLRDSFADFVDRFWPVVTGNEFVPNRATTAIVAALQDVADGTETRTLIAIAPGTGKSTALALYSAWRLVRDPSWRSIHGAHASDLATTESRRVRRLVESDDFRSMFPAVRLRADENTAAHWATDRGGVYYAIGLDSGVTGKRANELVLDDAMNAIDRFSKAARDHVWTSFSEGLLSRLDGDRAPVTVVMQRLDRDDLIGRLIAAGGWKLVELPAESDDGELLAPNVLSRQKLDTLKLQIGAAVYATQYLQRCSDDTTAVIRRSWWRFHHPAHVAVNTPRPSGCDTTIEAVATPKRCARVVIAVDLTFGSMKGD